MLLLLAHGQGHGALSTETPARRVQIQRWGKKLLITNIKLILKHQTKHHSDHKYLSIFNLKPGE